MSRNFVEAGAHRLVLAGVLETRAERHAYEEALGLPLAVCRLRVALPVVHERLRRRHENDPAGLVWHLHRSGELDEILTRAAVEDVIVDATTLPVQRVAEAVRDWMAG